MRRNISKGIILSLIISIGIFNQACDQNKVRKLAKVEDDVAQGLLSSAELIRDAKANGTISQADVDFLKPLLLEVGNANKTAINISKTLVDTEEIPLNKQQEIIQAISFLSDALTTLNNEGQLRIHDPQNRILFSALVLAAQTSANSIIIILNIGGKK